MASPTERFKMGAWPWRDDLAVLVDLLRPQAVERPSEPQLVDVLAPVVQIDERCPQCHLPLHEGRELRWVTQLGAIVPRYVRHERCTGLDPAHVATTWIGLDP